MQTYTSANTSVNSKNLPAIYKKINFLALLNSSDLRYNRGKLRILDYGCGKYWEKYLPMMPPYVDYIPYDLYWLPEETNKVNLLSCPDAIVCSNVLNVITPWQETFTIHSNIRSYNIPYFITIYEGDKSSISRMTKKDCWQWNMSAAKFLRSDEILYHGVITKPEYTKFIY